MKKIIIGIISLLVLCLIGFILLKNQSTKKIYLSDKYYENKNNSFQEVNEKDIKKLKEDTYILYTFNSFCKFPVPCDSIFEQFMKEQNITIVSIPYDKYKKTEYVKKVKYAPSIIIIKNNKVIAYLDANKDEDVDKYQDINAFTNWIKKYIYLKNKK